MWQSLIRNEVDQNENDIKDFKLLNSDLNNENSFSQTPEEANESVQDFIRSLKSSVVAKKESQIQCENVFYLNKKEISKSVEENNHNLKLEIKSENTRANNIPEHSLFTRLKNEISSLLIPVGILVFSYIIYSIYNN